jgi:hypothetical protein
MRGDSKRQPKAPGFAKTRYNKDMRKIWPWPIVFAGINCCIAELSEWRFMLDASCIEGQLVDLQFSPGTHSRTFICSDIGISELF